MEAWTAYESRFTWLVIQGLPEHNAFATPGKAYTNMKRGQAAMTKRHSGIVEWDTVPIGPCGH